MPGQSSSPEYPNLEKTLWSSSVLLSISFHFGGSNQGISLCAGSREAGVWWKVAFSAENGKIQMQSLGKSQLSSSRGAELG